MTLAAIVPVRSIAGGKTRLAGVLDDAMRAALNRALLAHTLGLAAAAAETTYLVSPDPAARAIAGGAVVVDDPGGGLNAAIAAALTAARADGATRLAVVPTDLPLARPKDVAACAAEDTAVAIVADRRGSGTNLLCLDATLAFEPRFGAESFAAHRAEAARLGVAAASVDNPRLALDIDTPEDWADWGQSVDRDAWIRAHAS